MILLHPHSSRCYGQGCLGMFRYDVTKELSDIHIPVLIIAAGKDRLNRPDASLYMKEHLPNAEVVTVSPGNHQALLERHGDVNRAAQHFIEK